MQQRERLNEKTCFMQDAIVRPRQRKVLREGRRAFSAEQCGHKSNRLIDATMSFYGLYIAINQQVTLQNQDPKLIVA
jgi:hypothetical protein